MEMTDQQRLDQGRAAMEADRYAEAYRLLLPLAEAGHAEAQGIVGSLLHLGTHRFETLDEFKAAATPAFDAADEARAFTFLKLASDAGVGPASFNLAGMVVEGHGGGTWEERKKRASALFALAYAQGFTAFGHLMNGEGPGQPYFRALDQYIAETGCAPPGE